MGANTETEKLAQQIARAIDDGFQQARISPEIAALALATFVGLCGFVYLAGRLRREAARDAGAPEEGDW